MEKTMWILFSEDGFHTDLSSDEMKTERLDLGLFSSEYSAKVWLRENRDLTGFVKDHCWKWT